MLRTRRKNAKTTTKCGYPRCEHDAQARNVAHAELFEVHWV